MTTAFRSSRPIHRFPCSLDVNMANQTSHISKRPKLKRCSMYLQNGQRSTPPHNAKDPTHWQQPSLLGTLCSLLPRVASEPDCSACQSTSYRHEAQTSYTVCGCNLGTRAMRMSTLQNVIRKLQPVAHFVRAAEWVLGEGSDE